MATQPRGTGSRHAASSNSRSVYNEAQLRAILETSVEGIITIDERGIIESFNRSAEEIFGRAAKDVIGENVRILMPAPDSGRHDGYLANYLTSGHQKIIGIGREVFGKRKDGSIFPMHLSVSEVRYEGRRIFTGFVHDLTQRAQAQELATRLGRIIEDSVNEVYVFDAQTLRFTMVNRGARVNLGYTMDELTAMTPVDLKPRFTRETFFELIRPLTEGRQEELKFETVHRRKDGSQYPVDVYLQLTLRDGPPSFIAIVVDASERVSYENKLRQERDLADSLIETARAIVLLLDPEGRILRFNRFLEELSGYKLAEVVGHDWFETFLAEDHWESMRSVFRRSLRGSPTEGFVNPIITKAGTERQISWWDRRLCDANGEVIGVLAIGHDVTDLRSAQEKVVQAERLAALGEAMAGLAHESRNALQRIQVASEMLLDSVASDEEAVNYIHVIRRAQDDLQRVLQEVREYAAPIQLAYEVDHFDSLVRAAWEDLQGERTGRAVSFVEHSECSDLKCELDPYAIKQVLRNILENALAACDDPVEILVSYSAGIEGEDAIAARFRDNGPGLRPDQRDRVFDSFYTTKTKGTGLGLAISRRIIQAHGGSIAVNPDIVRGAEFVVTIPRHRP